MARCRVLSLLAACTAACAAPAAPPEDGRLERTVSISRPRVYLGELVDELSRTTGVSLAVTDRAGAPVSGVHLSAYLKKRPLREVMAAVVTLLATRDHAFEWQATGRPPRYHLIHTPGFEAAGVAARRRLMERWAQDLRTIHAIAQQPDREREMRAQARLDVFPGGTPRHGQLDLLAAVPAEQLDSLLGGAFVALDQKRLSARGRDALGLGLSAPPEDGKGPRRPPGLFVRWEEGRLGPVLWLGNGPVATNVLGSASWDGGWLSAEDPNWQHLVDARSQAFLRRKVARDPQAGVPAPDTDLWEWLKRIGRSHPESFIADPLVVAPGRVGGAAWIGKTWEDTVSAVVIGTSMVARTDGPITVFRHLAAPVHPRGHLVTWARIADLRRDAAAGKGYLSADGLLAVAALAPEQGAALAEEFPDVPRLGRWRHIFQFQELLVPAARRRLLSAQGLPYPETGLVARRALHENAAPDVRHLDLLTEGAQNVTVALRREMAPRPIRAGQEPRDVPTWVWEVRTPERTRASRFHQEAHRPLQPEP